MCVMCVEGFFFPIVFICSPFSACKLCDIRLSFLILILAIYVFSFFLCQLARGLSILLIFSKYQLFVLLIFPIVFPFYWFVLLSLLFPFFSVYLLLSIFQNLFMFVLYIMSGFLVVVNGKNREKCVYSILPVCRFCFYVWVMSLDFTLGAYVEFILYFAVLRDKLWKYAVCWGIAFCDGFSFLSWCIFSK